MNIDELKSKYPSVYAEAVALGEKHGTKMVRAKICKVLPLASENKRTRFAIKCIKDGTGFGAKEMATYGALQIKEFRENKHDAQLAAALEEAFNVGKNY